ncbi:hypothetical protein PHYBLDRAFT_175482 [Phycomyces blakesleeanus NRRL 1555(-)]|uniref:Transposase domain-containing protein n=1 Tax=Phycomyces blakesleeanus (strain ATCC 8743b / DSM 1359 / FGSC 10004 / NBRC 33097 / NRRL 1555) TaxID=763407 RepID=A0A167JKK5_PHYB8|nr:hypothetical protein PHYBLDRAFT_175482 [Phycomyces blakesleeanus NRRL 1555(-)]OAD66189.1 hypothetical protein PHYBLDRAFT_175482 [Phycomyces blakesleeanus NRRL 1555(-)]|eukprot:XP_018284229.1 hypothetical protein PHYBLDRAFT_175482 [Phycomyces blakesleeanus NRRL 1555(-)]
MSSTIKQNFEECYCTKCIKNYNGYTLVSKRTAQRHGKKAALKDAIRSELESGSVEVLACQSDLPTLDISPMSVDYEVDVDFNDMDFEYESNENAKDTVDIDVEEVDTECLYENMFSNTSMPENPVHRFIATFTVLFASRYVVNKGAVVLIEFINKLLKIYKQDFQLPTSLPGLQHMTGFCELSKAIRRFVACEDCHAIYKENQSVPPCCVFVKTGACAACNCELTKKSLSGALVPKRSFHYQSIKNAFKILFNLRGTIIDLMHNLFLGTAKRMMDQWIERGVFGDRDFTAMQKIADKMIVPRGYTALKSKIGKKFAFMKADERKSWVLIYSPVVLKSVLSSLHFNNWVDFVHACHHLVKPSITFDDINTAHRHLEKFCEKCNKIYIATILTCNMHLHLHIQETILDFGPVYSYWLFAFERYNCLLKNISTNGKNGFKATFMRCFVEDIYKSNEPLPPTSFPLSVSKPSSTGDLDYPHLLEYYKLTYLTPDLVHYQNAAASPFFVDNQIIKLKSINILGQVYYGNNGTTGRGSYVQSLFLGRDRSKETTFTCQIKYIFIHSFTSPPMLPYYEADFTHHDQHVFVFVNWLPLLGDKSREKDGVDICGSTPLPSNYHSILSVHRISLEVAIANYTTGLVQKKTGNCLTKKALC